VTQTQSAVEDVGCATQTQIPERVTVSIVDHAPLRMIVIRMRTVKLVVCA
jgi:hypothetical protein